jgi:hypothetical protein
MRMHQQFVSNKDASNYIPAVKSEKGGSKALEDEWVVRGCGLRTSLFFLLHHQEYYKIQEMLEKGRKIMKLSR